MQINICYKPEVTSVTLPDKGVGLFTIFQPLPEDIPSRMGDTQLVHTILASQLSVLDIHSCEANHKSKHKDYFLVNTCHPSVISNAKAEIRKAFPASVHKQ